ncbi:SDR family NAD(P)-dependent oxidoreductase [Saccharopolyspora sp. CA-218241]|uniref:SDR family NAD(P)-dependent oxidoreductase n=1 Tax=Saccharopolyspora sp. CA-218241 TaxID=3240027 RepID=UPI003D98BA33
MGTAFDLTGRTAVVTGGGRGLGRGLTTGLLRAGADVVVLQRSPLDPDLVDSAAGLGRELECVPADLADPASTDAAVAEVLDRRAVDVLVNNAGVQARHAAEDFPDADFDHVLDVNLRSVFRLCKAFGRPMLERGRGKIVNIASLLSFQGGIRVPAYAASKGGVVQLTMALCNEWAGRGVNVNAIAPGYMSTDLNTALRADPVRHQEISERIPAGRWGAADDLAGAVVFLSSAAADYVHGAVLPVDGGWLAR